MTGRSSEIELVNCSTERCLTQTLKLTWPSVAALWYVSNEPQVVLMVRNVRLLTSVTTRCTWPVCGCVNSCPMCTEGSFLAVSVQRQALTSRPTFWPTTAESFAQKAAMASRSASVGLARPAGYSSMNSPKRFFFRSRRRIAGTLARSGEWGRRVLYAARCGVFPRAARASWLGRSPEEYLNGLASLRRWPVRQGDGPFP